MRTWRVDPCWLGIAAALLGGCAALAKRPSAEQQAAAAAAAAPVGLSEGSAAPDASALGPKGKTVRVSDFRGKVLVLYFYPVDFAAGATAQAEEFRTDHGRYRSLGAVVVGVSTDDVTTHAEFTRKYKIPYPLLSDKDGQLAAAFEVPLRGNTTPHATFVIDRGGTVRKVFRKVRPWGHSAEVLAAVKEVAR